MSAHHHHQNFAASTTGIHRGILQRIHLGVTDRGLFYILHSVKAALQKRRRRRRKNNLPTCKFCNKQKIAFIEQQVDSANLLQFVNTAMGVYALQSYIERRCPEAISVVDIRQLEKQFRRDSIKGGRKWSVMSTHVQCLLLLVSDHVLCHKC
jgi:hypothetical protein